ncbi:MAG: hydrogenase maturation nickel metallochaperone HypA [Dehalococcoidales bacterium]|nr:hydrogenase maturation nickel metallochaperone HypA [Dehalococcoidales bacterium]
MHEFSITESILKLAVEKAAEAQAKKITRINLIIGDMSGIVGECVQFYFDVLSKDTVAAGAELVFDLRKTQARCQSCGNVYPPKEDDWSCPDCGKTAVDVVSGRECYMESLEVD